MLKKKMILMLLYFLGINPAKILISLFKIYYKAFHHYFKLNFKQRNKVSFLKSNHINFH